MRKLGLIQPGKIGDIVVCLPIAKWYADRGYKVVWPLHVGIIDNFVDLVDYVEFVPISTFDCREAHQLCVNLNCNTIIDIAFNLTTSNSLNTSNYRSQTTYTWDAFKYYLANVPFEEKWTLKIKRDPIREKALLDSLCIDGPYIVVQENASDYTRKVDSSGDSIRRIDITDTASRVFDWLSVIEGASKRFLIDSCFTNILEQLHICSNDTTYLLRHGYYGTPLADGRLRGIPEIRSPWPKI